MLTLFMITRHNLVKDVTHRNEKKYTLSSYFIKTQTNTKKKHSFSSTNVNKLKCFAQGCVLNTQSV